MTLTCRFPFNSLLAVVVSSVMLGSPESNAEESPATESLAERFEQLGAMLEPGTPEQTEIAPPSHDRSRLRAERQTSGLNGASLETDTSLRSPARGLTPSNEWQRMFPRKGR